MYFLTNLSSISTKVKEKKKKKAGLFCSTNFRKFTSFLQIVGARRVK